MPAARIAPLMTPAPTLWDVNRGSDTIEAPIPASPTAPNALVNASAILTSPYGSGPSFRINRAVAAKSVKRRTARPTPTTTTAGASFPTIGGRVAITPEYRTRTLRKLLLIPYFQ